MAYERVAGPLGPKRIDLAAALISAVIANANRSSKSETFGVEDFLVSWEPAGDNDMSPDQVWAAVQRAHAAFDANGR